MAQRLIDATPLENQLQYEACIQAGTPAGPGYGRALRLVRESPTALEWIPVEERLPAPEQLVITWSEETRDLELLNRLENFQEDAVTHWMALPDLPEEVQHETD